MNQTPWGTREKKRFCCTSAGFKAIGPMAVLGGARALAEASFRLYRALRLLLCSGGRRSQRECRGIVALMCGVRMRRYRRII